jgi:uridine kinase/ribulose-5-phosphate 4-epimerase/fuculose-1-phosphate aldolase
MKDYSCITIGKNMEDKPYIIGISGDSASGKSTIANFIRLYYGYENTISISGDDLHKWERGDVMWNTVTHLNPLANNLQLGDLQLNSLKEGVKILRKVYNHNTGKFDDDIWITPKKYIINEGLHSFYTKESELLTDLKIYIDTDENLITDFKVERDTNERGYTKETVIELISKRKKDSEHVKEVQIKKADVVIKITKMDGIDIIYNSYVDYMLFEFIKNIHRELHDFEWMNQAIGNRLSVVQSKGGNISSKLGDNLIIKESGGKLKNIKYGSGYSIIDYKKIDFNNVVNDNMLDDILVSSIDYSLYKKPSMETGFHTQFKKYVFHTHPIYLNCILSLENAADIIDELFSKEDFDYTYLNYYNPGLELTHKILNTDDIKDVVFLENHGLIVSSDNYYKCIDLISRINTFSKEYISKNTIKFKEFDLSWVIHTKENIFTFPDSVIINDDETIASQNYILYYAKQLGKIKPLSNEDIEYLKNLKSEKYRK